MSTMKVPFELLLIALIELLRVWELRSITQSVKFDEANASIAGDLTPSTPLYKGSRFGKLTNLEQSNTSILNAID